jgi:phosphoribosylamine---glycine ligase
MKILLVGSGGREHTLAWKLAQSDLVNEVLATPGNVGIAGEPKCRRMNISAEDIPALRKFALDEKVDLTVVGPEAPLVAGLTDAFGEVGLKVFGPSAKAAQLEGSKVFTKSLLQKYNIPSAEFEVFEDFEAASKYLKEHPLPVVVKADGLAAGKGVFVCRQLEEALAALTSIMKDRVFGDAGNKVIIEECLEGEEASFIALTDGKSVLPLASSQDHKPIFDDDKGPNTGGMGAYSPAPVVTDKLHDQIMNKIMFPVVRALEMEGAPYLGFLYAGLMIKDGEAKTLEFNARMGDPEAQPLLFRMKSDLAPLMVAAIEGTLEGMTIQWEPLDAVCVVMASAGYPGSYEKGKAITGIQEAESLQGVKVFHAGTGLGPEGLITAGGRVLGVTAKSSGISQAIHQVYRAVEKISWENAHYRKDIAKKALARSGSV